MYRERYTARVSFATHHLQPPIRTLTRELQLYYHAPPGPRHLHINIQTKIRIEHPTSQKNTKHTCVYIHVYIYIYI